MTDKRPSPKTELTAEERHFIVQTLQQLELRGTAEALAKAINLISTITTKLAEEESQ